MKPELRLMLSGWWAWRETINALHIHGWRTPKGRIWVCMRCPTGQDLEEPRGEIVGSLRHLGSSFVGNRSAHLLNRTVYSGLIAPSTQFR